MNTHADKTQENKSQSVANALSQKPQKPGGGRFTFQFVDNRPGAVAQRKLQEMADNSPRVLQFKAIQEMANNSVQTKQAAQLLEAMAHSHATQQQQPIQEKENKTGLPGNLKPGSENVAGYSMDDMSPVIQTMITSVVQRAPIDLSAADVIKSGPPPTLKSGNYYYKVFSRRVQAEAMETQWDDADTAGVLTPVHKVVQVTRDGNRWAFRSKEVAGTFFQFSKSGHTDRVTNWIDIQTNRILLQRLRKLFAYVQENIGDGQGFFENSDGGNIWFIDINLNGRTPNAADVVTAIDQRLEEL